MQNLKAIWDKFNEQELFMFIYLNLLILGMIWTAFGRSGKILRWNMEINKLTKSI